jgi:ADP-L-glycero-D-manno-heptose 6-epimerase
MERVLVVGGAGFIGSRCVAALEATGCAVTVVDSFATGRRESLRSTAAVIEGDPRDPLVSAAVTETQPDAVLYVGGVTDTRVADRAWMVRETLEPFRAVTAWARGWDCRLVYASSAATYGNGPVPMRESQSPSPHNAYGSAKLAMEHLAADAARDGLSLLGLRYFNVYGPGEQHKGETASMVRQLALQLREHSRIRLFEDGQQRRDFVHVDDVVRATIVALSGDARGVVNVGSGREHSFQELASTVADAIGEREFRCEYVPTPSNYQARTWADVSRAAAELGFEPRVPFAEGVSSYARDVASNG